MYKNILLCTDGSPAAEVAADYAIWFAKQLNARLRALYITDIRLLEGPWMSDLSGAVGAQPYLGLVPQIQKFQQSKAAMILAAVDKHSRDAHVSCETAHETGGLIQVMLEHERRADLVVLGQRGEHAQWSGGMLGSGVERMVRASVKPCLVTPEKFQPVKHMLIAHDGSVESFGKPDGVIGGNFSGRRAIRAQQDALVHNCLLFLFHDTPDSASRKIGDVDKATVCL